MERGRATPIRAMGRSGGDHVERTFHADRVLAQLHAIYEALRVDAQARHAR